MTINELIARLKQYRADLGGDAEVRLMTQQIWPFENAIVGLTSGAEINAEDPGDDDDVEDEGVLYVVEGDQLRYGSTRAWEVAR